MTEIERKIEPLQIDEYITIHEIENASRGLNREESLKSNSSAIANRFYTVGMLPFLFILHILQVIKVWSSNIFSTIPTNDFNELQDTRKIQQTTEDEIKHAQNDQLRIEQDMDRLQERLLRLDERRRQRLQEE